MKQTSPTTDAPVRWEDSLGPFPTPLDEIARRAAVDATDISANLVRIEHNAKRILADPVLADAVYIRRDAEDALLHLRALAMAWASENIAAATDAAFRLGIIDARMVMRFTYDKHIRHSRESKRGASKGRAAKAQQDEKRSSTIAAAVEKRMEDNRGDSLNSARHHVADNSNSLLGKTISFDAVRRATSAMKPRKKMKK